MPKAIEGWLHFKNSETKQVLSVPAIAAARERDTESGENPRFALIFRFPNSDGVGEWDQLRAKAHLDGNIESAKKWSSSGFYPADDEISSNLQAEIATLLSARADANASRIPADKRVRYARLDDWGRGWGTDLSWDPLYPLANSFRKISELEEMGAFSLKDETALSGWLEQPVLDLSKKSDPAPSVASPALESPISAPIAAPAAELAQADPIGADAGDAIDDPAMVFGGPQAPSFSALAQAAAKKVISAPRAESDDANSAETPPANSAAPISDSAAPLETPAGSPSAEAEVAAPPPAKPERKKTPVSLRSVRLPRQAADGSLAWDSALFAVTSFLHDRLFSALSSHWRGFREENGKKQSLYNIDALFALRDAGAAIDLDGLAPNDRHMIKGTRHIDAERFALAAYSGSKNAAAEALSSRAKANILWKRAASALMRGAENVSDAGDSLQSFCLPPDGSGLSMKANFQTGAFSLSEPDSESQTGFSECHYIQRDPETLERARRAADSLSRMGDLPSAPDTLWMPGYSEANVRERQIKSASEPHSPAQPSRGPRR